MQTDGILDTARSAYRASIGALPTKADGSKMPAVGRAYVDDDGERRWGWKPYTIERPTDAEMRSWFGDGRQTALGFVCGSVSGHLEAIDFDAGGALYEPFKALAIEAGHGDLIERVEAGYLEETPTGGRHLVYRCAGPVEENQKLARRPKRPEELTDDERQKVEEVRAKGRPALVFPVGLIETRGEGGYIVVSPSNGTVHANGGCYRLLRGDVATIATITADERRTLLTLARSFDAMPRDEAFTFPPASDHDGWEVRPGDDFAERGDWDREILIPDGWTRGRQVGRNILYTRPGKERGASATLHLDKQLFYVFTTSTGLEAGQAYGKFRLYGWLFHGGDFVAAAKALLAGGYGKRREKARQAADGDEGGADEAGEEKPKRESQATRLVKLAHGAGIDLWHTPDGKAYATIAVEGHREHWPLKSQPFRRWLARLYYVAVQGAPGSQAVQDALGVLEGQALFEGEEHPVYTRVAGDDATIYLDLADSGWRAVKITAAGWEVVSEPPVRFRRPKDLLALPEPARGGAVTTLRPFLNVADDAAFTLIVAWLIAALRAIGPYPVLALHGEQGSAKSTATRALRRPPKDERDLAIRATTGWCLTIENASTLPDWLSDALCALSTGGGFGTRALYTDDEEMIFEARRPVIVNGIAELATRSDLLDRALVLHLPRIQDQDRTDEATFWREFEAARPGILGALLDAVAGALHALPTTRLAKKPRMADFALWATAAEAALGWTAGAFIAAYAANRAAANDLPLEDAPITPFVLTLAEAGWEGYARDLLSAMNQKAGDDQRKQQGWPKQANSLTNTLRRLAPNFRTIGVNIDLTERREGGRWIRLEKVRQ